MKTFMIILAIVAIFIVGIFSFLCANISDYGESSIYLDDEEQEPCKSCMYRKGSKYCIEHCPYEYNGEPL